MKKVKHSRLLFYCSLIALVMQSCNNNETKDPFVKFDPYDAGLAKRIEAYNNEKNPNLANDKTGNPGLYIDFSSGVNQAFKKSDIREKIIGCYNTLITDKPDVYGLGSNQVAIIKDVNPTALGQMIDNPTTYKDIFAPIQKAVEQIVDKNNDALLITDFEEWQNNTEITSTAFLAPSFSKWLSKGNSIRFYIADYSENNISKHIYFTIFSCGNANDNSMLTKLRGSLSSLTSYDLSNKQYVLTTKYATAKSGGIFTDETGKSDKAKNILDLKDSYVDGTKNGNAFEFYPLGVDWKTIAGLKDSYKDQFKNFFRKLFIDLSDENAYTYGDFDVKVNDVSDDFTYFSKCREAENHKPKLAKGKNNGENKFADDETDEIALGCYNSDGTLLDEWKYKPKESSSLPEVFTLNKDLFIHTKADDNKNAEFAVAFHPNFNLKNIPNADNCLIRVDIILNTATPNITNPVLDNFKWTNSKKIENKALRESILATLQEPSVKPNNKIIYSYYVKTLQ